MIEWLLDKIGQFVNWWGNLTGTKTVWYGRFRVHWPSVTLVIFIWILMWIALP